MQLGELEKYLCHFLNISSFKDYAPNGLQIEGKSDIKKIVTGVSICRSLIEQAVSWNADAILVHHGFFWKNEPAVITGMKQQRIKALLAHDISLFGFHLPLDAHPVVGNNVTLAAKLGIESVEVIPESEQGLVWRGRWEKPLSVDEMTARITKVLNREPLHLGGNGLIHSLAWCSGGAQDYIDLASSLGVDAFISGEVSERTFYSATELGVHYFAAGHHATERYGIKSLGEHLAEQFDLEHRFIDIDNPV